MEMGEVTLRFHAFHIRREGLATNDADDYLEGDVDFDLVVGGAVHRLAAKVKQSAGATLAEPLEILPPARYRGPIDYGRFRACVEQYARRQIRAYLASPGLPKTNVRLRNIRLPAEWACNF
jgi:hypothetical protein